MKPSDELIDEIYRERVRKAHATPASEKLEAGLALFQLTSGIMADAIRNQFPGADDRRVLEILRERLALARRLENGP
ncbi:MAG: hypothetical protein GX594_11315 [Pirellulaceae bacterium]|nr:hypothetical protein [Pirellulaceae bacterium]